MSDLPAGSRIAERYAVIDVLGRGGMSIVYRARDEWRDREVAIKLLHFAGHEAVQRARRETAAMNMLDPARVARVFDAGETERGEPYIAMELVRGTTARELIKRGKLKMEEAFRIVSEVGVTLATAHRIGLVHRDVKPDNVLVQDDGRVVLLDFGVVKRIGREGTPASTWLTEEGTLIGTPAYLAPEQALGQDTGAPADQFALAVTAFELLTGRLPWTATEAVHVLAQILSAAPLVPSETNPRLPRGLDAVFARAMTKEAQYRFSSTSAFIEAMDAAARGVTMPPAAVTRATSIPPPREKATVRVKGVNFRSFLAAFARLRGQDAVNRAFELLPPDLGGALRHGALVTGAWYAVDGYKQLHKAAQRACHEGPALSRAIARDAIMGDFRGGVYRLVTLTLSPQALFRWAPRVVASYFDGGSIVIEQSDPGYAIGRFEAFHGFDRNLWEDMIGGAVGVLELAGAKNLAPRVLTGGGDGDAHMAYAMRWDT